VLSLSDPDTGILMCCGDLPAITEGADVLYAPLYVTTLCNMFVCAGKEFQIINCVVKYAPRALVRGNSIAILPDLI
jgi:hypothetical protein